MVDVVALFPTNSKESACMPSGGFSSTVVKCVCVCAGKSETERGCACTQVHRGSTHRLQASSGRDIFYSSQCPLAGRMPVGDRRAGREDQRNSLFYLTQT